MTRDRLAHVVPQNLTCQLRSYRFYRKTQHFVRPVFLEKCILYCARREIYPWNFAKYCACHEFEPRSSQSAVPATNSAPGDSQSAVPATNSTHGGSESAVPAMKSALRLKQKSIEIIGISAFTSCLDACLSLKW